MTDLEEARERALAALCGFGQTCPEYPELIPWVCTVLHVLTGIVRSVTGGHFFRFKEMRFDLFDPEALLMEQWTRDPLVTCPHHRHASGDTYWNTRDASTTDPDQLHVLDREAQRLAARTP